MRQVLNPVWQSIRGNMLRTRLIVGLLSLLIILLATGLYSIQTCGQLGDSINRILDEDYGSIDDLQQIKLACEKLNYAVVLKLANEDAQSTTIYETNTGILNKNLKILEDQVRQPEGIATIARLKAAMDDYFIIGKRFFDLPAGQRTIPKHYVTDLSPLLLKISDIATDIQSLNRQSMRQRRNNSKIASEETVRFLLLSMIIAVVVGLYASYTLGKGILQPIATLTASIREIGQGNLDLKVPVFSRDELGQLAESVNHMASQLYSYRESTSEKILRLHKTMQTTLDSFPDPIFVIGTDLGIQLKNPAADELVVKLGAGDPDHLPPSVLAHIQPHLDTKEDYLMAKLSDAVSLRLDNEERFYLLRIMYLREEKVGVFGVAIVLEDVTRLRLVDDIKNNLVSTVSHELKTPLTSIRTAVYLLQERQIGPLNQKQVDLLQTAKQDTERLLRMLNNLMDLARLEESGALLNRENSPVWDIVTAAVLDLQPMAREGEVELVSDIPHDLPDIWVDRQRFAHVLSNFISNAIKHTPKNGTVRIFAMQSDRDKVRISVIDQGPGISSEHQERIFDKFYRVPGQFRSGAGLGLSIAREIAKAHEGDVGVVCSPGGGSEFSVEIPVAASYDKGQLTLSNGKTA